MEWWIVAVVTVSCIFAFASMVYSARYKLKKMKLERETATVHVSHISNPPIQSQYSTGPQPNPINHQTPQVLPYPTISTTNSQEANQTNNPPSYYSSNVSNFQSHNGNSQQAYSIDLGNFRFSSARSLRASRPIIFEK